MANLSNRILLTGFTGQVGGELAELVPQGYELVLARDGDRRLDLTNLQQLSSLVRTVKPSIIINPAAYTAVDKAQSEPQQAEILNVAVPELLAKEAQTMGAVLVHYSTDYVFNGDANHGAWSENSQTGPVNVYGATKLAGEEAIRAHCENHLIFRTSWVYSSHGNNFMKTMLRLAGEREQLKVVDDQIGAPTTAHMLARLTYEALAVLAKDGSKRGLYHLTSSGKTSWHGFASSIIEHAKQRGLKLKCDLVQPIPSSEFPTPAPRPANSVLDCSKFERNFMLTRDTWESGLDQTLDQYLSSNASLPRI